MRELLSNTTSTNLKAIFADARIVVIDEAQRIENIGIAIKLITDHLPGIQLIATGSSAFELANKINEPLTGRKYEFSLFPLSYQELSISNGILEENRLLQNRLLFGTYPEVVNNPSNEREVLSSIAKRAIYIKIF